MKSTLHLKFDNDEEGSSISKFRLLNIFNSGITEIIDEKNRLYNIAYDNEDRIHIFEIRTMTHDVFNFE